jgi:hypothetical protein
LVGETLAALAVASIAVRAVPFRKIAGAAARGTPSPRVPDPKRYGDEIKQVRWAVEAVSSRVPWRTVCFQKGLAAHFLLKRRGVPTRMHYGIDNRREEGLRAHVWVTSVAGPVIGTEVADEYVCVATFPAALEGQA